MSPLIKAINYWVLALVATTCALPRGVGILHAGNSTDSDTTGKHTYCEALLHPGASVPASVADQAVSARAAAIRLAVARGALRNKQRFASTPLTLASALSLGFPFDPTTLEALSIDRALWQYYNPQTGQLTLPSTTNGLGALQVENGAATQTRIRLNYRNKSSGEITLDFLGALLTIPNLSLDILATNGVDPEYAELITRYSHIDPTLKRRIHLHTDLKPELLNLAIWAQDDSKPLELTGQKPGLLVPYQYISAQASDENEPPPSSGPTKSERYRIAAQLAAQAQGLTLYHSPLIFDGGNIIVGERHVFVGSHIVDENVLRFRASRQNIINALSVEFGKPVIELGAAKTNDWRHHQADYHIDLTLAIGRSPTTGKEIAFVASEALALKVLKQGALYAAAIGNTATSADYMQYAQDLETLHSQGKEFIRDAYADKLAELGYEVRRIPSINTQPLHSELMRELKIKHLNAPLNYTNVTFVGAHALVPKFDVAALDRAAARVYEDAGFHVTPMACAAHLARGLGGPRCVSSVIRY